MTALLQTSSAFASASASGTDWRDVGRQILEALESVRTENDGMNIGFLYVSAQMADDVQNLLTLLKTVTRISHWYGSMGQGVCGCGVSYADTPAAVAMIGKLPENAFHGFTLSDAGTLPEDTRAWLAGHMPVATLTHGDLNPATAAHLCSLRDQNGLYLVGGFAPHLHIADGAPTAKSLSGVMIDASVRLMTAVSFGCALAGPAMRITQCDGNTITTIDERPAYDVLYEALQDKLDLEGEQRKGHVHAAFPLKGADTSAYLTRNITQADESTGIITVAHHFERGDAIRFVYRDAETAASDLTQVLTGLYGRAASDAGAANLKPKAILYFGCGARLPSAWTPPASDEASIIKRVFGDIPMAGFYATGEICNGHIYGYSGVIVVFL